MQHSFSQRQSSSQHCLSLNYSKHFLCVHYAVLLNLESLCITFSILILHLHQPQKSQLHPHPIRPKLRMTAAQTARSWVRVYCHRWHAEQNILHCMHESWCCFKCVHSRIATSDCNERLDLFWFYRLPQLPVKSQLPQPQSNQWQQHLQTKRNHWAQSNL